ncbi:hypothetical protein M9Y10_024984 [Tritrichomonas musculus]|uniref:Anacyclamide/piricyclamide family prenylated cyclic peptide n=1 Tax=Tritrichomonas musculus TaxID=1915356 RepID=A0ABR2HBT8_9EUKA
MKKPITNQTPSFSREGVEPRRVEPSTGASCGKNINPIKSNAPSFAQANVN